MDALDEFFHEWCEPEAWCERCGKSPAIHVVVQDDEAVYGSIVTYVRIWDPTDQTHLAVCRRCSQAYLDALGSQGVRYSTGNLSSARPLRNSWIQLYSGLRRGCRYVWRRLPRAWFTGLLGSRRLPASRRRSGTRL